MTRNGLRRILLALTAAVALSAVACAPATPRIEQAAREAARLDAVVPIVGELRVTDFDHSAYCRSLVYARGAFGVLDEDACARDGTGPFDDVALADYARLAAAVEASGVAVHRIHETTYDAQGVLDTARFRLVDASITDDWEYLYDRTGAMPKRDEPGRRDFTKIADHWWFVRSFDD